MKKFIKNKGITLIALVVTVIVLVILVGVVINAIMNEGGIFNRAEASAFKAKMSKIAEELDLYNMALMMDSMENGTPLVKINAGELLKEINTDSDSELNLNEEDILDIKKVLESVGNEEEKYVIVYNGELYYVTQTQNDKQAQWCQEIGIKIWDYIKASGIKVVNGNYELVKGVYLCTPKLNTGFTKENTRYIIEKDGNLSVGNWINRRPDDDWYDYANQKWANLYVENNGVESYYVWIPRYVYKVDDEKSVSGNERMDVKFVDTNNCYKNPDNDAVTTWEQLQEQGYQLPEAFWWDNNGNGTEEAEERLPGYWMSKYQLSELTEYTLDFSTAATTNSITIQDIKLNTNKTVAKYTYAINGSIIEEAATGKNYTIKNLAKGNKVINVTALDENGEIIGSMTKIYEVADVNEPDISAFDPSTTFYVYWDEEGNEHNEIPISMDPPTDWYDYTTANWANIVTRNDGLESYYVWIPRYQYALDATSKPEKSYVKFIKGTSTDTDPGYQIPEAFWWDNNGNGEKEEGEQLTGYWMSKYQLTNEENKPRINAEMTATSTIIRINDITGTLVEEFGNNIQYEYYINGKKMTNAKGNSSTEHYEYTNLTNNTTYTINIIARNKTNNAYIGAITKKIKTIEPYKPDVSSFNKDCTYYVEYQENGTEKRTPISASAPENWYDYSKQQWANIVTTGTDEAGNATETYFVWIPRYEYKILADRTNLDTSNRRIDVNFITTDITEENCTPGYQVPEAFWWDNNGNGEKEEGEQLTGYWITKYQLNTN